MHKLIKYPNKVTSVSEIPDNVSIAPNGNIYLLPSREDYKKELLKFKEIVNKAKENGLQVVVVQGLGFVGIAMAAIVANSKNKFVIGLQRPSKRSYWKIPFINAGISPIKSEDPNVEKFIHNAVKEKRLIATFVDEVISYADIVISDVQCDVRKRELGNLLSADVEISSFLKATKTVAKYINPNSLFLIETTVPPGTTEYLVKPIFKKYFKERAKKEIKEILKKNKLPLKNLNNYLFINNSLDLLEKYLKNKRPKDFDTLLNDILKKKRPRIAHSYERVMPGRNYISSIIDYPRVYAGINNESAKLAYKFLSEVLTGPNAKLTRVPTTTDSEFAKCTENTYRAGILAIMRAIGRFAEIMQVDLTSVVNAIKQRPTHTNIMVPNSPSTGGYCLPKDPFFLIWSLKNIPDFSKKLSEENQKELNKLISFIASIVDINDTSGLHMVDLLIKGLKKVKKDIKGAKILVAGASYREDIGDTRYAPYEVIIRKLQELGAIIRITDPYVEDLPELKYQDKNPYSLAKFFNNQSSLKKLSVERNLFKALKGVDAILFIIRHKEYRNLSPKEIIKAIDKDPKEIVIVDCGTFTDKKIKEFLKEGVIFEKMYHGHIPMLSS